MLYNIATLSLVGEASFIENISQKIPLFAEASTVYNGDCPFLVEDSFMLNLETFKKIQRNWVYTTHPQEVERFVPQKWQLGNNYPPIRWYRTGSKYWRCTRVCQIYNSDFLPFYFAKIPSTSKFEKKPRYDVAKKNMKNELAGVLLKRWFIEPQVQFFMSGFAPAR